MTKNRAPHAVCHQVVGGLPQPWHVRALALPVDVASKAYLGIRYRITRVSSRAQGWGCVCVVHWLRRRTHVGASTAPASGVGEKLGWAGFGGCLNNGRSRRVVRGCLDKDWSIFKHGYLENRQQNIEHTDCAREQYWQWEAADCRFGGTVLQESIVTESASPSRPSTCRYRIRPRHQESIETYRTYSYTRGEGDAR